MDKQDKIEQLKKVLTKASSIEKGKEIAVAKEFIQIDDKIDSTKEEIGGKLDKIIEDVVTPVNQEVSITGSEIVTIRGKDGRDGKDGERGEKGEKGDRGDAGKDGLDGYVGRDGIDGLPGRDGLDGRDGKDGATGLQGKPGKDGKDGITEIPEKVIKKTLKKIGYDSLKGGENLIDKSHLDKAVSILDSRTSFLINKINNLPAGGGGGTWGSITGTLSSQTDLQSALDAKQDLLGGTGFVKSSAGVISYDTSTYITTSSASSTYVPYTGATADVSLGSQALQFGGSYRTTITYDNANEATLILSANATDNGKIGFGSYNSGYRVYTQGTNISATRTIEFPNANGTFVLSVNSTTPDAAGNVVISSGAITVGSTSVASGTTTRILYNNAGTVGEYTLTGTGTVVAMQTAPTFVTSITTPSVLATANDSGALGASGTAFSDLFLASGAVINFASSNVTMTHSSGTLTFNNTAIALGSGAITTTGNITANSFLGLSAVRAGASGLIYWNGSTQMKSPSDGVITMWDNANTSFGRLQFGGTTSSFPSIKRSSAILQARLADDSAYTDLEVADEAYGVGWNGSVEVPTKNAVYDKIETVIAGAGANTALSNLASVAINTTLVSDTNNTDDLGTTAVKWANLYVTNIGATATRTTKGWFTDIESTNMPTVGGTAILTSLTAPQFTTIELGHATANTLSASGGVLSIEGKAIPNLTDGGTFLADISVPAEAYSSTWNGSNEVPTKNDVYDADFYKDDWSKIFAGLGSTILFRTIGAGDINFGSNALVDGVAYYAAVYISKATTITGLKWYQSIQGNYTADNNNYVALYSYSGGTMTQVAISTNDGNIWKVASNTFGSAAFTTPFAASPGVYFIGALWNASATVTAPLIGQYANSINAAIQSYDFTNSAKVYSTVSAQTTLPATQAMSGTTGVLNGRWFGLY